MMITIPIKVTTITSHRFAIQHTSMMSGMHAETAWYN